MRQSIGQEKLRKAIFNAVEKLPSAMVFYGPEGVGKSLTAQNLAQVLLCEARVHLDQACGICGSCVRVAQKQSESLFWLEPEGSSHKIQSSRDIIEFLSLQSIGHRPRIVVINEAHLMNAQAANSLLKTLEEPPANTYFILITHKQQNLLPTIKSRTVHLRFSPLTTEVLRKLETHAPEWCLRASRGSLESLKTLMDPSIEEGRIWAGHLLQNLLADPQQLHILAWREDLKDREFAISVSRVWLQYIRDAFFAEIHPELVIHQDQVDLMRQLAALPKPLLAQIGEFMLEIEPALVANRDSVLVYEEFFIKALRFKT